MSENYIEEMASEIKGQHIRNEVIYAENEKFIRKVIADTKRATFHSLLSSKNGVLLNFSVGEIEDAIESAVVTGGFPVEADK